MTTDFTENLSHAHWITNSERITLEPDTEIARLARLALFNISKAMAKMRKPGTFKDDVDYTLPSYCRWWHSLLMRLIDENPKAREGEWFISLQKHKHIFKEYLTNDLHEAAKILEVTLTEHEKRYLFSTVYDLANDHGYHDYVDVTRPFECHELFPGLVFVNSKIYQSPVNLLYYPKGSWELASKVLLAECRKMAIQVAHDDVSNPLVYDNVVKAARSMITRPVMHYDGRNIAPGPHVPKQAILVILPIEVSFDHRTEKPWEKQVTDVLIKSVRQTISHMNIMYQS